MSKIVVFSIYLTNIKAIFVTANSNILKMHDTRLIRILKTFSEEEFKNFGKFIASPYFTTGRDLTPLYKVLKGFYPEFEGKGLEKEKVFAKLDKGKYNEQLMRIMISDLYKMAIDFLSNLSAFDIPVRSKLMLAESALRRRLLFLAEQQIEEVEEIMHKAPVDIDSFYHRHGIEMQKAEYNYVSGQNHYKGSIEKICSEYTIFNFLDMAANHLHNLYTLKTNFNIDYSGYMLPLMFNNLGLEAIEPLITGPKEKELARIYLYYILSHINAADEQYFYKLKELLFKNLGYLEPSLRLHLLKLYGSLCTKKMFELDFDKFTVESFESKKKMISEGTFHRRPPNFINPIRFHGVVSTGIQAGDHKWVEKMVSGHINEIAPEYRSSLSNYFNAEVCFLKKDFENSLSHAGKIDISAFFLKPVVYNLQLRLYYELNYVDEALSTIDSFRHFIANNKQANTIVSKNRTDFLKFYKKLLMYKNGKRLYSIEQLKAEQLDPATLQKKWMMEKLSELG